MKLVVISAGALSSPQILEHSGIGSPNLLKTLGIPVISALHGVGENCQDHPIVLAGSSRVEGRPDDTGDLILRGEKETLVRLNEEYKSGKGTLAWNFIDAGSKLNPNPWN